MTDDQKDIVTRAMKKSFSLGQIYWQQADSDYQAQWAKADATYKTFLDLVDETVSKLEVEQ
jgi:hypothetical protein